MKQRASLNRKHVKKAIRWGVELEARMFDKPTPERMKQACGVRKELVSEDPKCLATMPRYRARAECMLDGYRLRGQITESQHAAGIIFRDAYQRAALRIQTRNVSMVVVDEGRGENYQESMSASRQRYGEAMKALTLDQKVVIIDVAGNDMTAGGSKRLKDMAVGLQVLADLWHTKSDVDFCA